MKYSWGITCTFVHSMHCIQCTNYRLTTFVITAIYHTNHTHTAKYFTYYSNTTSSQTSTNILHLVHLRAYFYARTKKTRLLTSMWLCKRKQKLFNRQVLVLAVLSQNGSNDVCLFKSTANLVASPHFLLQLEVERDIFEIGNQTAYYIPSMGYTFGQCTNKFILEICVLNIC